METFVLSYSGPPLPDAGFTWSTAQKTGSKEATMMCFLKHKKKLIALTGPLDAMSKVCLH